MPGPKRVRQERTDEWASIQQRTLWPEQELYEQIRPLLLFGETAGERAKETGAAARGSTAVPARPPPNTRRNGRENRAPATGTPPRGEVTGCLPSPRSTGDWTPDPPPPP